ncbi:MAG: TonB-dependent siderophore receptor [Cyanobacteria bacterium P01_A01_bin.123]
MKQSLLGLKLLALLTVTSGQLLVAKVALAQQQSKADTVAELIDESPEASRVQITGIRLDPTEMGLQLVLETVNGDLATPTTTVSGNALVVEIPNAVLTLPDGNEFQQFEPAEGIAFVQVTGLPGNRVQIAITGTSAPPTAAVNTVATGLTLAITPGIAQAGEADDALQIVVTGEEGSRYLAPSASTATRTDTPLDQIPQSIQVIPQAVLEDQQVFRLNDALRNASGVVSSSLDQRGPRFIVRGFDGAEIVRDGFRLLDAGSGNVGYQELSNIEQIEVLRGPASVITGAVQPGGVINLVTEQPLPEPAYEIGVRVGNRGLVEPSIDITGPLTADGALLYRLNALYRREDFYRDFDVPIERFFIAPVVSWAIDDRTDWVVELEYSTETRPADFGGLPAFGDRVAEVPFNRITGEPDDEARNERFNVGYRFEHRFSDSWKVRNSFRYLRFDPEFIANAAFQVINPTTGDLFRGWVQNNQLINSYELQTNVVGEFSTGSIAHTLLMGVDLFRRDFTASGRADLTPQLPFFNIFNPVYGVPRPASFSDPLPVTNTARTDNLGIYVQDQVTLADNLFFLAGVRYDTVSQSSEDFTLNTSDSQSDDAFSPRVGIVYQPIEDLSLYTSYSTSFSPNSGTTRTGEILDAERGQQFEIGARANFFNDRLSANLAFFNLTKRNVATADPTALPGQNFVVATGEQRSQGIELDITGEILPSWNIIANYAYTDADITQDNSGLQGNRLFGVPEHNANLWTTYEIQQGDLAGLGFGVGFNYVSERFGDNANSFVLDSYFLTNAGIFYRRNNWEFALNARNLFDVAYIDSSEGSRDFEIRPGEGFTLLGSFSIRF